MLKMRGPGAGRSLGCKFKVGEVIKSFIVGVLFSLCIFVLHMNRGAIHIIQEISLEGSLLYLVLLVSNPKGNGVYNNGCYYLYKKYSAQMIYIRTLL